MVVAVCVWGCESPSVAPPPEAPQELEASGDFFEESALLEGAVDLDPAPCAGEGQVELRGQVAAPFGRLALAPAWWESLIPTAHAASLPDEQTVSGVTVVLGTASPTWDIATVLGQTQTDALGRFCLRTTVEPGPTLMLRAGENPHMRRLVLDARDVNIHLTSEAVVRLVASTPRQPSAQLRAGLFNLTTIATTQVDFLQPVSLEPNTNTESALQRIDTQLRSDPRVVAALERLSAP